MRFNWEDIRDSGFDIVLAGYLSLLTATLWFYGWHLLPRLPLHWWDIFLGPVWWLYSRIAFERSVDDTQLLWPRLTIYSMPLVGLIFGLIGAMLCVSGIVLILLIIDIARELLEV